MKKRYVMLFTFTTLVIAGILISKPYLQKSDTTVQLYKIQPREVEQTVTCNGRIEAVDSEEVRADLPYIAQAVHVKAGDKVNKGDVLFTVDVSATKQVIATAGGISPSLVPDQQIKKEFTAPISGIVRLINASPGEAVSSDQPCAVISSSDALQVKVSVHESALKNITVGQSAVVSGTAFAESGYEGKVTYISPSARQQYVGTNSETVVDAIITLMERDESLKPGLSAKSKILVGSAKECIIVPFEYVLQDESNQEYVYVYENKHAVKKVITTGKEWNNGFQIESGLSKGDQVIQNPTAIKKNNEPVVVEGEEATPHA